MNERKLPYARGIFAFKKAVSIMLMLALMCFFTAGCGRKDASTQGLNSKKSFQQEQVAQNNNANLQSNKNSNQQSSSNTTDTTNSKLDNLSNQLDSLDSTLNGLDNSSDINKTESIINNIN